MKIYTRGGDSGMTRIKGGEKVSKTSRRIEANGALDELNSVIGVARAHNHAPDIDDILRDIQCNLMILMSRVATPGTRRDINTRRLPDNIVEDTELLMDSISASGAMSQDFVLPGGNLAAATLQHARAVCRRAERELWRLHEEDSQEDITMRYLNRLSDLLFSLARLINFRDGGEIKEEKWERFGSGLNKSES